MTKRTNFMFTTPFVKILELLAENMVLLIHAIG